MGDTAEGVDASVSNDAQRLTGDTAEGVDASVSIIAPTDNLRLRKAPVCHVLAPTTCTCSRPRYALCYRGIRLVSYNRCSPTNGVWRACPATSRPAAAPPEHQRWGQPRLSSQSSFTTATRTVGSSYLQSPNAEAAVYPPPSPMLSASRTTLPKAWTPPSPMVVRLPSTSPPVSRRRLKKPRLSARVVLPNVPQRYPDPPSLHRII